MFTCTLCRMKSEGDSPALLFVNRYGTPRHLCSDCEALIDAATGDDAEKALQAREKLREVTRGMRDSEAMQVLKNVLEGGIAEEDEEIEKEYEELRMTEEEEKEAAKEAEILKKKENSFLSWLPVIGAALACAAFLVYWFVFR